MNASARDSTLGLGDPGKIRRSDLRPFKKGLGALD